MHDGSIATLEAVVECYDRGGNADPSLETLIRPLRLSIEEKRDLRIAEERLSTVLRRLKEQKKDAKRTKK